MSGYEIFCPRPSRMLEYLERDTWHFGRALLVTSATLVSGLTCSVVLATAMWSITAFFPRAESLVTGLAARSQSIPIPLLAPLLSLITGPGFLTGLLITTLIAFFPVYLGWRSGVRSIPEDLSRLFHAYRPRKAKVLLYLHVPASVPHLLTNLRGAINLAVLGAVLAEIAGGTSGLGVILLRGVRELKPEKSWSAMVGIIVLASVFLLLLRLIENLVPQPLRGRQY